MSELIEIWNMVLFQVDGQNISLGQLLIAITLVVVGYFVARMFSQRLGRTALSKFNIEPSMRYTLERLSFYIAYCFIVLIVLQILHIPLTVFTFVGGALAIGIGFGSQNVVNNFISGIIVMFSQPLRVHDWVEVDGMLGEVVNIGIRATIIRLLDNKDVVIPNSQFLEKSFVNWTLTDQTVSQSIKVGVAYGSDVELVKKILVECAKKHASVLKEFPVSVLFQDFGDSSLNFEVFYRVNVGRENTPRSIASDIRGFIDSEFRKNNIEIPYPHIYLVPQTKSPHPIN